MEPGELEDAQQEYEQKIRQAEKYEEECESEYSLTRNSLTVADLMEAITEAPTSMRNRLFQTWKDGDFIETGITISDMVEIYCRVISARKVDRSVK